MESHGQLGSGDLTSIASQALLPTQAVMGTLRASHHGIAILSHRLGRVRKIAGKRHRFPADHMQPLPSEAAARPIFPQHGRMGNGSREVLGGRRQRSWGSRQGIRRSWPENGADASWFLGGRAFLTLVPQRTGTTKANAPSIQDAQRAIALRSAFLRIERTLSRTA
jgi:hypothetical protein